MKSPLKNGTVTGPRRRPVPRQTEIGARRRAAVIFVLALGGFAIGTTEFTSMGLLPLISNDLGISEGKAGRLISAYALGVVVGAPMITAVTGLMPRRRLLIILTFALIAGNFLSVVANSYPLLMGARFIAGFPHGAYFSIASLAAASMASPGQRGRAIALVGSGLPVASVVGVPLTQALSQAIGWQFAYLVVTLMGLVTLTGLWFLMPHMVNMPATRAKTELSAFGNVNVWLTLLTGTIGFGGMFAVYTYISWTMTERAGLPKSMVWIVLMAYGIGMVLGNLLGGRLADWNIARGILASLALIAVVLTLFFFTSTNPILGTINFGLIGFFGSCLVPGLQIQLMDVAGDAQTIAGALNNSALNLANAGGAILGGVVVSAGLGYGAPALAGALLAVCGVGFWLFAWKYAESHGASNG